MKHAQPKIKMNITPRFAGAPKKTETTMDFLVEIFTPERITTSAARPPLNLGIAIDTSGSMSEAAHQEPGHKVPGRWEQRKVYVHPWHNPNAPFMGIAHIGHHFEPAPPQPDLPTPAIGYEWYWIPESFQPGRKQSKMEYAIKAAHAAVDALTEQDKISVVSFNSEISLVFPSGYATAENKRTCKQAISRLSAGGGTHLHEGWKKTAEQVCMNMGKDTVNRVLLLTDGQPSDNMKDPKVLRKHTAGLAEHGVTTSTFGVGISFSEDLLQAMAEGGDGRYYYLDNAATMGERFSEEFSGLSQLLGRSVRLQLEAGASMEVISCLNNLEKNDNAYMLPNAVRGHDQQVVVRCKVSGAPKQGWDLKAICAWRDTDGVDHATEVTVTLPAVTSAAFKEMQEDTKVGERVAELEIAIAQQEAMKALDRGDVVRSRAILNETMLCASGSAYANVQGQVGKLMAFTAMADSGETQALRKSVSYDVYETNNSRKTS